MPETLMRLIEPSAFSFETIARHLEKRLFETATSLIMVGVGLMLLVSPSSIEISSLRYLLAFVPAWFIIVLFLAFGLARFIALVLNGKWMPWGAYLRSTGAVVGALAWGQWCASFFQLHTATNAPLSLGAVPFAVLALAEIVSFYRALEGAKHGEVDRLGVEDRRIFAPRRSTEFAGVRSDRTSDLRTGAQSSEIRAAS